MRLIILLLAAALAGCGGRSLAGPKVMSGLDVLAADDFAPLKGRRIGVITNKTGIDRKGRSLVSLLLEREDLELVSVLATEHGFETLVEAGAYVSSGTLRVGGRTLPLHSLYGGGIAGMRPQPHHLAGIDALVFDIQDVGARFYTYLTTMAMALEETKRAGIAMFVLDRPNPVGGTRVEGPLPDISGLVGHSAVCYLSVPTRHGMTAGEIARLHNASVGHPELRVIPMRGWERAMWFDATGLPWVPPSPNMPDLDAAALYTGIAKLEFSNLSVGRGTPTPFGWVGAPWLDADDIVRRLDAALLEGVEFSVETRVPTKSVYKGESCPGVRIKVTDRDGAEPIRIFAHLAAALRDRHPDDWKLKWDDSKKLIGLLAFKDMLDRGAGPEELARALESGAEEFKSRRREFLLYPEK